MTDLYTTGTGQIKTNGGTRTVQLKPSSTLLKSEPNHNEIAEADYIALASLRDQGQWVIHTPYESRYTIRMLEGGTMAMTLARWLEEAGYQNVKDPTISRSKNLMAKMMLAPQARSAYGKWEMEKNVNNAINELTAGRTVFLCVATNFANFALQKPRDSWYVQSFAGHWATLLAGQIQPTGVDFSIRTWGEETAAPITMPWSKVGNWYRGYISATP